MASAAALSSLIALIYDAALNPERWPDVLRAFADATAATCAALLHHDVRDPRGTVASSHQLDPEAERRYAEHFGSIDPWVSSASHRGLLLPGVVHIGEELVSRQDLARTEYYNDLARPFGITRVLSSVIRRDAAATASISVLRPDAQEPFGPRERELMQHLLPHLRRALEVHRRVVGLEMMKNAIGDVLDRLPNGVILARHDGSIAALNRAAESILKSHDGLADSSRGLVVANGAEHDRFHALIRAAARTSAGRGTASGGVLAISRPSLRRPYAALVTPVRVPPLPPFENERAIAAVFVTDPEQAGRTDERIARSLWGLTTAEAQIAEALTSGRSIREIADARSITLNTARWHLKQILSKTQTHTQSELARLLTLTTASAGYTARHARER